MMRRCRAWLLVVALLAWPLLLSAQELTLGVFAYRPKEIMLQQYQPLADYLSQVEPGLRVKLSVLTQDELEAALRNNRLDMVLTNPGHFLVLRHRHRLSGAIATLETLEAGQATSALGGVILTRADDDHIQTLRDLKGHRVAIPGTRFLGGFQSQVYELAQVGVHVPQDVDIVETGSHDAVVSAVLGRKADAGFVRSGLIESLAREGKLDLARVRVINQQDLPGFPFLVSTRLYPEWAFAVLPHIEERLVRRIAAALYNITPDTAAARAAHIQGFTVPADYLPVEILARELRMPPFDHAPEFTVEDVWKRYQWAIVALAVMLVVIGLLWLRLLVAHRSLQSEQAQVAESEETFRRLFEDTLDPVLIMQDRRFINCNQAALDLLGMTREQLINLTPADISPEYQPNGQRSDEKSEELLNEVMSDAPVVTDWTHLRKDGTPFIVEVSLTPLVVHGERIIYCGWTDITQRKAAKERSSLLAVALESAGNGIVITDIDGYLQWANPAFSRLTGYSLHEAIGRRPGDLVRSGLQSAEFYQEMWQTILGGHEWRGEVVNRKKSGEFYTELLTITPVLDDRGQIRHFVGIKEDITERKRMQDELLAQATTDTLTGLANRRHFFSRLEDELSRLRRLDGQPVSLLMLDLDFFKQVNDTLGHAAGDAVLRHLADLMRHDLRDTDLAGRLGGEEFAVILPGANLEQAVARAERFRQMVQQSPAYHEGQSIAFTASFGVTSLLEQDISPDQVLQRADAALYLAKAEGRNRVEAKAL